MRRGGRGYAEGRNRYEQDYASVTRVRPLEKRSLCDPSKMEAPRSEINLSIGGSQGRGYSPMAAQVAKRHKSY